jgi:hypothetical protein
MQGRLKVLDILLSFTPPALFISLGELSRKDVCVCVCVCVGPNSISVSFRHAVSGAHHSSQQD